MIATEKKQSMQTQTEITTPSGTCAPHYCFLPKKQNSKNWLKGQSSRIFTVFFVVTFHCQQQCLRIEKAAALVNQVSLSPNLVHFSCLTSGHQLTRSLIKQINLIKQTICLERTTDSRQSKWDKNTEETSSTARIFSNVQCPYQRKLEDLK